MNREPYPNEYYIGQRHTAYRNWFNDCSHNKPYLAKLGAKIDAYKGKFYICFSNEEDMVFFVLRYS